MTRIILFGAPGSGKGTMADLLRKDFGYVKISTGDLIRQEVARQTDTGRRAKAILERGDLVSDAIIIAMVKNRLSQDDTLRGQGYILDGFPRTLAQAEAVSQLAADSELAIFLEVSEAEVVDRLGSRLICSRCGAIYNQKSQPALKESGDCRTCGGALHRRDDDNPQTVGQRLRVYLAETGPVIDYYRAKGNLMAVDGSGSVAAVYERLKKKLA